MSSIIYFIQRTNGDVKIGTTVNLKSRLSILQGEHGSLKLLGFIKGGYVKEKILHWCLSDAIIEKEWFELTPQIQDVIDKYASLPVDPPATYNKRSDVDRTQISIRIRVDLLELLEEMQTSGQGENLNRSRTWLIENAVEKQYKPLVEKQASSR